MPRPLRIEYAGACDHVINRGNYRRGVFSGEGAAEAFERTLDEAAKRYHWRVHVYVVMSDHFHLAAWISLHCRRRKRIRTNRCSPRR